VRRSALPVLLLALLALAPACDDGDPAGGEATETPTTTEVSGPTTTPDATATLAAKIAVRQYDFESDPDLTDFISGLGDVELQIGYADMTQDGVEDAFILISSAGTAGDIAALVYKGTIEGVEPILELTPEGSSFAVDVRGGGTLVVIDPIYAEGDPLCCPSAEQHTIYEWDAEEEQFVIVDQRTEQVNP